MIFCGFLLSLSTLFSEPEHLRYVQSITDIKTKELYILYEEPSFQDKGWYVLKGDESYDINKRLYFNKAKNWEKYVVFHNIQKKYHSNPKIFFYGNKYLIFEKEGYYFGLYDRDTNKVLANINDSQIEAEYKGLNEINYLTDTTEKLKNEVKNSF